MPTVGLFGYDPGSVVTMLRTQAEDILQPFRGTAAGPAAVSAAKKAGLITLFSEGEGSPPASQDDDQFMVFQLNPSMTGPTILDATQVTPNITGSRDNPDVLLSLEMLSFHLGSGEGVAPDTKATLRMDVCKDETSSDRKFDPVFWSIAAGLDLYNTVKNVKAETKELKSDFSQAFSKRPIEVPGGLGRVSFQVIKHKEPPWWRQVFKFLESDTAKGLVTAFGLPAVTLRVVQIFDNLLNRIADSSPEVLFRGRPMRLAFSKQAVDDFTGGNPRVSMGTLNRGFCVFTRARDFDKVADSKATYYPTIGKLAPSNITPGALNANNYDDPLKEITYAVFRLGTKEVKLDPTFNYQS